MGHFCALLLSGSDIRFLGTTGSELELEPDRKNSWISGHPEPDIRTSIHTKLNFENQQRNQINKPVTQYKCDIEFCNT